MNYHDRYSIFGDTYKGVPNPMIPHKHPYPTRYHGPVYDYPTPGWGYNVSAYARAPFDGVGFGGDDCPAQPAPTSPGQKGPAVKCWQKFLISQGFDLGKDGADGDHAPRTEMATQAFKAKNALIPAPPPGEKSGDSDSLIPGVPDMALYVGSAGLVILGIGLVLKSRKKSG